MRLQLGVLDYVQFYFLVPGSDLNNGLRYLSTDANTQELFKCLDPIDHKIDIYAEHVTLIQQQLLVRDISIVDATNLGGCDVGVKDVDVDGNGDDNEVDVEGGDEALADDEFEKRCNLVDERNDAKGNDGNSAGRCGANYASSDQLHSPDNSDGEQKKKLPEFKLEYLKNPKFVLGMSFKDNKKFKESFHRRQVSAHWVAEKYVDQFRTNIYFQAKDLVATVEQDVNVEHVLSKAYRARDIARGMVRGDFCEQYTKKGLLPTLVDVVLDAYNRFRMRYLFANFKKNHQGKDLKDLMWSRAKSSTRLAFESYMKQMEIVSKEACDELRGRNAFPYYSKCNMLLNNICETFNSNIVETREKLLVNMLKTIRRYLMDLTRISCKHAMHVIAFWKERAKDYVHDFYKKDTYIALYSHLIQPCNGPDLWPDVDGDAILPPIHKIQLGRIKIDRRRKEKDKVHIPYKMKRNQTSLKCAHCHQSGHDRRNCRSKSKTTKRSNCQEQRQGSN
ncbi:hypothetical protein SO802_028120 [Lithocarpus litseifolius]|uniref:CCHC-type domain-containing protein n=1 Tax=Lithocarpus litseifolius TaxID=425828 RepID=A0AAW2BRC8_9ROSI